MQPFTESIPSSLSFLVLSIDEKEELVNLSLLPVDTGKPDILPESLSLPLRLIGEEKKKHDTQKKMKRTLSESEQVTNSLGFLSLSRQTFLTSCYTLNNKQIVDDSLLSLLSLLRSLLNKGKPLPHRSKPSSVIIHL